ncbi:Putative S-adenosyl-L-methionine-dependent methyltransferase [Septoria linicola]|uniref:S-adenosyl-L-methionine-dependent methyltransferase n=1 Tax=Septoria linicola TaxID=215465 RepID=A0A9Q9EMC3_9PEZI|nr:putative S-adenosyl-L-methionine-dependent methyltransferase [Septoria linicola]USW56671.1 Putative S-adenosyl-L-methionine-dependent methyltransferase [Septoria linicola]
MTSAMIGSVEKPDLAVQQMHRVTARNGVLGLAAWAGGSWVPIWQKAVREALQDESYVSPRLMHKDWSDLESVKASVEAAGWEVVEAIISHANWGFKNADEVDWYVFSAGNPIVGLLMEGLDSEKLKACRRSFRRVIEEDWDDRKSLIETAILVTAKKSDSLIRRLGPWSVKLGLMVIGIWR